MKRLPQTVVADANVVAKWVLNEPDNPWKFAALAERFPAHAGTLIPLSALA